MTARPRPTPSSSAIDTIRPCIRLSEFLARDHVNFAWRDLDDYAESVSRFMLGPSLAASMSRYVITELATKANVTVETEVEVVAMEGNDHAWPRSIALRS